MAKAQILQNRHRARELAAQLLYSLDTRTGQDMKTCLDVFTDEGGFAAQECLEVQDYMRFLVAGTWERRQEIDNLMRVIVTGWRPERMVAVDRVILRLAIFEGFLEKKIPYAVAISEAVELARCFGTEESGKFVNGVLAKILHSEAGKENAIETSSVTTDS